MMLEKTKFHMENYYIEKTGAVFNKKTKKIVKPYLEKKGYWRVKLCRFCKSKTFLVHRLLAETYIQNPNKLKCVNHIDGNKQNNKLENLEWVTPSENSVHRYRVLNKYNHGERSHLSKLKENDALAIRHLYNSKLKGSAELAKQFLVSQTQIRRIASGRCWPHI